MRSGHQAHRKLKASLLEATSLPTSHLTSFAGDRVGMSSLAQLFSVYLKDFSTINSCQYFPTRFCYPESLSSQPRSACFPCSLDILVSSLRWYGKFEVTTSLCFSTGPCFLCQGSFLGIPCRVIRIRAYGSSPLTVPLL